MKKKFILILCVVIALLIGGTIMFLVKDSGNKIGNFNVDEYDYYINQYPSDKTLGSINDAEIAKEKAENVWLGIYGDSKKSKSHIKYSLMKLMVCGLSLGLCPAVCSVMLSAALQT